MSFEIGKSSYLQKTHLVSEQVFFNIGVFFCVFWVFYVDVCSHTGKLLVSLRGNVKLLVNQTLFGIIHKHSAFCIFKWQKHQLYFDQLSTTKSIPLFLRILIPSSIDIKSLVYISCHNKITFFVLYSELFPLQRKCPLPPHSVQCCIKKDK